MNIGNKRKDVIEEDSKPKRVKKECDYGESCYRRNPAHFREFSHKHLDSILDVYSGSGDYPIPEKYVLERLTIMEQLDVIVEKELYTPWKDRLSKPVSQTNKPPLLQKVIANKDINMASSSKAESSRINAESSRINAESSCRNVESSRINAESSCRNVESSRRNAESSSRNVESNCRNAESSRINAESRCRNAESSSRNAESSSRNAESSGRNAESSSGNADSCRINAESSRRNAESSSRNAELSSRNAESCSRNAESSSRKAENEANVTNNNAFWNPNYKKAADYRPVVPPTRRVEDFLNVVRPKNKMAAKHASSAPYHIFYTTITAAEETHSQPNSITFLEILDASLGELKCSLQINFMVELGWLLAQYYFAGYSEKKLTILYGEDSQDLKTISQKKPHVDAHKVSMATPFGTHHTKMMILCYEDGSLRVVISTANLYIDDWENRTQGLWFSPRCPELPPDAMYDGDSPTQFKSSLLRYLADYKLPALTGYVERVKRCDFSRINVFLVASVPGSHSDMEWGMKRVGSLLRQYCCVPAAENRRWPLLAQASSIGSYGAQPKLWLTGDFLQNFAKVKCQTQMLSSPPDLKLIYPSLENVRQSHDGLLGGGCLPYGAAVNSKQPWLKDFLYQWRATSTGRNRAMPHIKSYTRISPDNATAAYYMLTSANASKAAWGSINKGNGALRLMSYEAGVLLLPRFVINEDFFPLEGRNRLQLPYDVPPTKYTSDMSAWVMDYLY